MQRRLALDRRTTGLLVLPPAVLGWPAAPGGSRTLVGVPSRRWRWQSAVLVSGLEAVGWGVRRATRPDHLVVLIVLGVLVGDRRRRLFCAETIRCGREQLCVWFARVLSCPGSGSVGGVAALSCPPSRAQLSATGPACCYRWLWHPLDARSVRT